MITETIKHTVAGMTNKDWDLIQDAKENGNSRTYVERLSQQAETQSCKDWLNALADKKAAEAAFHHLEEWQCNSL